MSTLDASRFNGATTLNGAVTLGDAATDIITMSGTFAGGLVFEGATADDDETLR